MKTRHQRGALAVLAVVAILMCLPTLALGDTVTVHWSIKAHPLTDLTKFKQELDGMVAQGYVPAGISRRGADLWVLWLKNCPFYTSQTWNLAWYADPKAGIRQKILAGRIPVGLTLAADVKYMVMFSRMPTVKVESWELEVVPATRQAVHQSLSKHQKAGYVPMGIDLRDKKVRIVYVKVKGWEFKAWKLDAAKENVLEIGINNHLQQGWVPVGLIFGSSIMVLYVK